MNAVGIDVSKGKQFASLSSGRREYHLALSCFVMSFFTLLIFLTFLHFRA